MKFWTWKEFERRRETSLNALTKALRSNDEKSTELIEYVYEYSREAYRLGYEAAVRQAKRQAKGGK